jgi:hypothetical protein
MFVIGCPASGTPGGERAWAAPPPARDDPPVTKARRTTRSPPCPSRPPRSRRPTPAAAGPLRTPSPRQAQSRSPLPRTGPGTLWVAAGGEGKTARSLRGALAVPLRPSTWPPHSARQPSDGARTARHPHGRDLLEPPILLGRAAERNPGPVAAMRPVVRSRFARVTFAPHVPEDGRHPSGGRAIVKEERH